LFVLAPEMVGSQKAAQTQTTGSTSVEAWETRTPAERREMGILSSAYDRSKDKFLQGGSCGNCLASRVYRHVMASHDPKYEYELGVLYSKGKGGVALSDAETVRWWGAAAKQGEVRAQYSLAIMLHTGRGGSALSRGEEDGLAFKHMRDAADQGHAKAQYNVALMCEHGRGTGQSDEHAKKWLKKAAAQGLAPAQFALSVAYRKGSFGLRKDEKEADVWFKRAQQHQEQNQEQTPSRSSSGSKSSGGSSSGEGGLTFAQLKAYHGYKSDRYALDRDKRKVQRKHKTPSTGPSKQGPEKWSAKWESQRGAGGGALKPSWHSSRSKEAGNEPWAEKQSSTATADAGSTAVDRGGEAKDGSEDDGGGGGGGHSRGDDTSSGADAGVLGGGESAEGSSSSAVGSEHAGREEARVRGRTSAFRVRRHSSHSSPSSPSPSSLARLESQQVALRRESGGGGDGAG